jgi:hypothetical protein
MPSIARPLAALFVAALLSGCAAAAAPCKVSGAVISTVPIIGGVVGGALETCGDVID